MEQQATPHILSGAVVRDVIKASLISHTSTLPTKPTLVIIQVGEREDSNIYIQQKINFGHSIGVRVIHQKLPESVTKDDVKREIERHNRDGLVTGIIVQLPLPTHIPKDVIESIEPDKDVDCLTVYHQQRLLDGDMHSAPATPRAIVKLLQQYAVDVKDVHVVVVGRSALVGAPTAKLLELLGAHVSVLHSKSVNPEKTARTADILVVACGVPKLVNASWVEFNKQMTIIDVGIHRTDDGLMGDVDIKSVKPYIYAYSPVPGGVGPVTVACLFEQLVYMHTKNAL